MRREPFKFLDAYTRNDKDIFFGRAQESEELYSRIFHGKLLLVYGVSGSGKTSLIQCGLGNKFEDPDWLPIIIKRKQRHILESIRTEVSRLAITGIKPDAPLVAAIRSLYLDHFKPIYLIFDQLEELFIFGSREERQAFARELVSVLNSETEVKVVFAIREEYLAGLSEFEVYLPDLFQNKIRIEKLSRVQALEAIGGPCNACGIGLAEGLSARILERLGSDGVSVELTYLQVIMDKLYRKAVGGNPDAPVITHDHLNALGQISDVLAAFLDEQLSLMPNPERAEAVLKSMVSPDGTKKPVTPEDISGALMATGQGADTQKTTSILQRFISARIVKEKDDSGHYELRHDGLAEKIYGRMTAIEKDVLEVRQMLENRFKEYKSRTTLLDAEILTYIAPYEGRLFLKGEMARFVEKSKKEAQRRRKRNRVLAGVAIGVFVLIVGILGALSYFKANEAVAHKKIAEKKTIEAKEQLIEARHNIGLVFNEKAKVAIDNKDLNAAMVYSQLALANFKQKGGYEEKAIARTVIHSYQDYPIIFSSPIANHHHAVTSVTYSPDGKTLASASDDKTIKLWDNIKACEINLSQDEIINIAKTNYNLALQGLDLKLIKPPATNNLYENSVIAPQWSPSHPFH